MRRVAFYQSNALRGLRREQLALLVVGGEETGLIQVWPAIEMREPETGKIQQMTPFSDLWPAVERPRSNLQER